MVNKYVVIVMEQKTAPVFSIEIPVKLIFLEWLKILAY